MKMNRWKPSRQAAKEFTEKMNEIQIFCNENAIEYSRNMDSYYFRLNGIEYRVSNHSVEASNAAAFNWMGEKVREEYHPEGRTAGAVYIHAGKTRIIEIYEDLKAGHRLDGRGYRKD